jgi:hypothetical protein
MDIAFANSRAARLLCHIHAHANTLLTRHVGLHALHVGMALCEEQNTKNKDLSTLILTFCDV